MNTALPIRRLLVDLKSPLPRHWCGGDAYRTAHFNALSMSFPVGEQLFIDAVRTSAQALPVDQREAVADEIRGFIGQEATHRHVHAQFNAHLARQGLVNHWEPRITRRLKRLEGVDHRTALGVTAATEHLTAVLSEHLLRYPAQMDGTEPRLRQLWLWHASEESEHRSTAFDLYRALGGSEKWRRRLFWVVSLHFTGDLLRQTANNLWHDGTWWRPSVWLQGWRFAFGPEGWARTGFSAWKAYLRRDFHPSQGLVGEPGLAWLAMNGEVASPISVAATSS